MKWFITRLTSQIQKYYAILAWWTVVWDSIKLHNWLTTRILWDKKSTMEVVRLEKSRSRKKELGVKTSLNSQLHLNSSNISPRNKRNLGRLFASLLNAKKR